jgi:hypothetical protein
MNMNDSKSVPKSLAREKVARSWLAVFTSAVVAGMMLLSPLASITPPEPRTSNNLLDRQLLFKQDPVESEETCAGGDKCQDLCDLDASCNTDVCQDTCKNPDDARGCGCTTTAMCWNEDCQTQCSLDYICESESCQAACNGDDEEKLCGCTEPQPECFKDACAAECLDDPLCASSSCGTTCINKKNALSCGCGLKDQCLSNTCVKQCNKPDGSDPTCSTQACQDACVTEENALACCGCIKPECGLQCDEDSACDNEDCKEACGSFAMQEACGCILPTSQPSEWPTFAPTVITTNPQPECYKEACEDECAPSCMWRWITQINQGTTVRLWFKRSVL